VPPHPRGHNFPESSGCYLRRDEDQKLFQATIDKLNALLQEREFLRQAQRSFFFLVGLPFRLVFAILRSSALLIDLYMPLEAPLREDFLRFPLLAANAAPAAICCFFDFAGI
jgi:hypothetical protein